MPRFPPLDCPATYEDLEKVPDIMVAEIVDGELHASPRPAQRHASVTSSLGVVRAEPFTDVDLELASLWADKRA